MHGFQETIELEGQPPQPPQPQQQAPSLWPVSELRVCLSVDILAVSYGLPHTEFCVWVSCCRR